MDSEENSQERNIYTEGWNRTVNKQNFLERLKELKDNEKLSTLAFRYSLGKLRAFKWKNYEIVINVLNKMSTRNFIFEESTFKYFIHKYNSVNTERVVEVPIINSYVISNGKKNVLEIGNVLSHYFATNHDVVDKYEIGPGIINNDALEFDVEKRYDLIVSISTIEHIGYDESVMDNTKILKVLSNLKRLLKQNGHLIVTVPLRYNPIMDSIINNNLFPFDKMSFMKRVSSSNIWCQTSRDDAMIHGYGSKYPAGNSIAILEFINR